MYMKNFGRNIAFCLSFLILGGSNQSSNGTGVHKQAEICQQDENIDIFDPALYDIKLGETTESELRSKFKIRDLDNSGNLWIRFHEPSQVSTICGNFKLIVLSEIPDIEELFSVVIGIGKKSQKAELAICYYKGKEDVSHQEFNSFCDKVARLYGLSKVNVSGPSDSVEKLSCLFDSNQQPRIRASANANLKILAYASPKAASHMIGGIDFIHKVPAKIFYPESFGINMRKMTADDVTKKYKIISDITRKADILTPSTREIRFSLKSQNTELLPVATAVFENGKMMKLHFAYFSENGTFEKFQRELSTKYPNAEKFGINSYDKGDGYIIDLWKTRGLVVLSFVNAKREEQSLNNMNNMLEATENALKVLEELDKLSKEAKK